MFKIKFFTSLLVTNLKFLVNNSFTKLNDCNLDDCKTSRCNFISLINRYTN